MTASITLYDHTRQRVQSGANIAGDTYIVNLYTVLPANATATTKAAAEAGGTQLATGNGYTQNTKALANVTISTVSTSNSVFDSDDVIWTPDSGTLTASFALVYNDTDTNDPPFFRVDFGGSIIGTPAYPLTISWDALGILRLL